MDSLKQDNIYNRLLEIRLEIEFENIPSPDYINKKIGLCNIFIEEIEKYSIQLSREQSAILRCLNDAVGRYDYLKQNLMATNADIKTLPNIRDREAKADTLLKDHLDTIKNYKNDLMDLKNLAKAVDLKIKNLYRANNDIKMQLRLMESHIKLGSSVTDDLATKSLMEEMKKSSIGRDTFEGSESEDFVDTIVDPSNPSEIDDLLNEDSKNLLDPDFTPSEEIQESLKQSGTEEEHPYTNGKTSEVPDVSSDELTVLSETPQAGTSTHPEDVSEEKGDSEYLSLSEMFTPPTKEMEKEVEQTMTAQPEIDLAAAMKSELPKNEIKSKSNDIDIDSLLKDLT